jgi:cell fate regulator YaaT (PSP1 superfamily)
VSVKMAKEQNLALNPTKISGQCGRLLCCLGYEFETYCCLRKGLPKCGKHVQCGSATGEVVKLDVLNSSFTVRTAENREVICHVDDLQEEGSLEPARKPAREQAKEHEKSQPAGGKPEGREKGQQGGGRRRRDRGKAQPDKEKKEKR